MMPVLMYEQAPKNQPEGRSSEDGEEGDCQQAFDRESEGGAEAKAVGGKSDLTVSENDRMTVLVGDCRETLRTLPDSSVDACVTDPPYELGFMGKAWDKSGVAYDVNLWREVLRVLKPGGHLLSFGGTRTYHRMACAIEDAGFEIRDQMAWVYGSGFPKSLDVSKAIDKEAGAVREVVGPNKFIGVNGSAKVNTYGEPSRPDATAPATDAAKQWEGWGTALKPAWEPICVARKPLIGTVAANVLQHGTGALNIDGCRVGDFQNTTPSGVDRRNAKLAEAGYRPHEYQMGEKPPDTPPGRWPANLIHDGSEEVVALFPETASGMPCGKQNIQSTTFGQSRPGRELTGFGDSGSAARFFYCAKVSPSERGDSDHPTMKPLALMRYLVRLVTPPGGKVLDPFGGSGTTAVAAIEEGFSIVLCELDPSRASLIRRRTDVTPGLGL